MHACARAQKYGEGCKVVSLDAEAKTARLATGAEIQYDALINTAPLDITLRWLGQPKWADTLSHRLRSLLENARCRLAHAWQGPCMHACMRGVLVMKTPCRQACSC